LKVLKITVQIAGGSTAHYRPSLAPIDSPPCGPALGGRCISVHFTSL